MLADATVVLKKISSPFLQRCSAKKKTATRNAFAIRQRSNTQSVRIERIALAVRAV